MTFPQFLLNLLFYAPYMPAIMFRIVILFLVGKVAWWFFGAVLGYYHQPIRVLPHRADTSLETPTLEQRAARTQMETE